MPSSGHDGRVVQDEGLGGGGGAALVEERHRPLQDGLGVLPRVGHRGGAEDEHRVRAVEPADPDEAADHVGQVGAEDPPVDVKLVDHDEPRFMKSFCHFVWCGRMPAWSMSGFVTTTWPWRRMAWRASSGVSPS